MNSLLSKLLLLATLSQTILAFAPRSQVHSLTARCTFISSQRHVSTLARLNSKQDEIEALEEKLRKLKEESDESSKEVLDDVTSDAIDSIDEPFEEMLSESWKDLDVESEDSGGVVKNLIGAAIFVVVAIIVSQIPVGQEGFDKYSTAKPNTSIDLGDLTPKSSLY